MWIMILNIKRLKTQCTENVANTSLVTRLWPNLKHIYEYINRQLRKTLITIKNENIQRMDQRKHRIFKNIVEPMPKRLKIVIKQKRNQTKY